HQRRAPAQQVAGRIGPALSDAEHHQQYLIEPGGQNQHIQRLVGVGLIAQQAAHADCQGGGEQGIAQPAQASQAQSERAGDEQRAEDHHARSGQVDQQPGQQRPLWPEQPGQAVQAGVGQRHAQRGKAEVGQLRFAQRAVLDQVEQRQGEQGADQQAALQPAVGNQLLALPGADQLQRQVDRRVALYTQQQAVRAGADLWQVEEKLWIGFAALGKRPFGAAVYRAQWLLASEQPDLQV